MTSRFVVTEIEGYGITLPVRTMGGAKVNMGLSVQVVDTAWNHRVVFTRRTDMSGNMPHAKRRQRIRDEAQAFCAALNATHEEAVAA